MKEECGCYGYCEEKYQKRAGAYLMEGQWLEELGFMIEAAVQGGKKDRYLTVCGMGQEECTYCGYCEEKAQKHAGAYTMDGQWLEEVGSMIEAAVQGIEKGRSLAVGCKEQDECTYRGYCEEKDRTHAGAYCPDGQSLEEAGFMIETAV